MTYLENNDILYDLQHGVRKFRSCESHQLRTFRLLWYLWIIINHLIGYHTLAFCINSNTMVYKKHSTLDPRLSVRPYTNSCCKRNTSQYSTSYIYRSPGYGIGAYFIYHVHKWLSRIIYRDIKAQYHCLKLQQDSFSSTMGGRLVNGLPSR
jgi:hypothetical protein